MKTVCMALPDRRSLSDSKKPKNKFTASRAEAKLVQEAKPRVEEDIEKDVEDLFFTIERKLGIASTPYEAKIIVQKLIRGERNVFVKANFGSNHKMLYDALISANKRVAILFLNPALEPAMRQCLPKTVEIVTLDNLETAGGFDILAIEQCELLEDILPAEYSKLKLALSQFACSKLLVAGLMTFRVFLKLKELVEAPFSGFELNGLKVIFA
jgi:hypothetical protein